MTPKILLTIVLYNEELANSVSYQSIKLAAERCKFDYAFYVHDNSTQVQPISEANVHYVHSPENVGLSKAYNNAAKYAKANGFEYLLLLDQDTLWNEDFFEKLSIAIEQNPTIKLFAPTICVTGTNMQLSPSNVLLGFALKNTTVKGINLFTSRTRIINSGLVININAFEQCGGYHENVFLDYSDEYFIEKFKQCYSHFVNIDSYAYQAWSNLETDVNVLTNRYRLYLECAKNYPKSSILDRLAWLFIVMKRCGGLTLRTKSINFINLLFTHYLFK
ncbi:MAG: glycosyltransferase [Bacteroidales bacterium]